MATEHVNITDPQIHEPKGVAAASAGQVYVADGAGSGAWSSKVYSSTSSWGSISGNATTTTIATIDTPVVADVGTGFVSHKAALSTISTAGRVTYDGDDDRDMTVQATLRGTVAAGTVDITVYFAVNGVVNTASARQISCTAATDEEFNLIAVLDIVKDDYIEVYIENNTDTENFEVTDLSIVAGG